MNTTSERQIPLLDLQAQHKQIRDEVLAEIVRVVDSQKFILGEDVKKLESEIASYSGTKHAIGCGSGSDALILALMALDVRPGDEVLTTPYTFFATAGAISRIGAVPVFVDVEEGTFNLDVSLMKDVLAAHPKVRAIIPVHLFGGCADMDPIMEMANERGIPVIEDAAQSIGSEYKGRRAGSIGQIGAFSFFPSKNLGGYGDGGHHDDGRCSSRREADGAAGPRAHGKVLSPMDRCQLAAGCAAGSGTAGQTTVSGRVVGGTGAKCGALPYAVGEARSSGYSRDAGGVPDSPRLQSVRHTVRTARRFAGAPEKAGHRVGGLLSAAPAFAALLCRSGAQERRLPGEREAGGGIAGFADSFGTGRRRYRPGLRIDSGVLRIASGEAAIGVESIALLSAMRVVLEFRVTFMKSRRWRVWM